MATTATATGPGGCISMEALLAKHEGDKKFIESRIKTLAKPRLGQKTLSAAELATKSQDMRNELTKTQESEVAAMSAWLEEQAKLPPPAPVAVEPTAGSESAADNGGGGGDADKDDDDKDDDNGDDDDGTAAGGGGPRKSKAQRRKEAKAAKLAEIRNAPSSAGAEALAVLRAKEREDELRAINQQVAGLGMAVKHIPADGHCMFRAVADQLLMLTSNGGASGGSGGSGGSRSAAPVPASAAVGSLASFAKDFIALRKSAADHIRREWKTFHPFLSYEATDNYPEAATDSQMLQVESAVAKYTERMKTTACWGGQPELRALAATIGLPIYVYQSGSKKPTIVRGWDEEGLGSVLSVNSYDNNNGSISSGTSGAGGVDGGDNVRISFHIHYYSSGEHYNSIVPAAAAAAGGR